jgi:hypothetical protein
MVGASVISTCWSTSGSHRERTNEPPQSGQQSSVWGWKWLTASGGNGDRKCCSCPGCPPFFRFLPPLGSGFFGLTMSLDGGLEEVEESLRAAANCCCRPAFSSSSFAMRSIAWSSLPSSVATRCARCSQFREGLASRSFIVRENTHPRPPNQDQMSAHRPQQFWKILRKGA